VNHIQRRFPRLLVIVAGVALIAAACSTTTPPTLPSNGPTASSAPATAAPSSAEPSTEPTASATTASSPTASAAPPTACAIEPQSGRLPSDRMTNAVVSTSAGADLVTFVFGDLSLPQPPQGASEGSLEAAEPPYTEGASGLPVDVTGEHVAIVRFTGMSLSNDVGQPTYDGTMDFRPDLAALRTVVNYDMSEGVIGWYIGYDGPGCITLSSDARSVTVAIDHPAG